MHKQYGASTINGFLFTLIHGDTMQLQHYFHLFINYLCSTLLSLRVLELINYQLNMSTQDITYKS